MKTSRMTQLIISLTNQTLWETKARSCQPRKLLSKRRTRSSRTTRSKTLPRIRWASSWILAAIGWGWTRRRAVRLLTTRIVRWATLILRILGSRNLVYMIQKATSTTLSSPRKCSPSWAVFKRQRPTIFRNLTLPMLTRPISIKGSSKSCSSAPIETLNHHLCYQKAISMLRIHWVFQSKYNQYIDHISQYQFALLKFNYLDLLTNILSNSFMYSIAEVH